MIKGKKTETSNANIKALQQKPSSTKALQKTSSSDSFLSSTEKEQFDSLCKTIIDGLAGFIEVGNALVRVHEDRLYREEFKSFEECCQMKFGMSRNDGYRYIVAAEVKGALPENVSNLIQNTAQANALSKAPKKQRAKIIKAVAKEGAVTAAAIAEKIEEELSDKAEPVKPAKKKKPVEAEFEQVDKTGKSIPKRIQAEWTRAEIECKELLSYLEPAKKIMEEKIQHDGIYAEISNNENTVIRRLINDVKRIAPHAVCPTCDASGKECKHCKGRGFISKYLWDVVPKEQKKGRK